MIIISKHEILQIMQPKKLLSEMLLNIKLKWLIKFSLSFLIVIFIVSCEGNRFADGYVYETDTSTPLDSVLCKVVETSEEVYTDSTGHYNVEGPFGGCMGDCKDMTVEYSKQGFKTEIVLNPGNDIIYLKKE